MKHTSPVPFHPYPNLPPARGKGLVLSPSQGGELEWGLPIYPKTMLSMRRTVPICTADETMARPSTWSISSNSTMPATLT